MQQYFPHDSRFNWINFGNTPIYVIFQALEYGHRFYKEDKHCNELGVATLTSYFVNANKDPKKGSRVTPSDFFFFKSEGTSDINPDVAATFFSLINDGLIPDWGVASTPIKEFGALRDRGRVTKFRAMKSPSCNLLVICPQKLEHQLFCGFIIAWEIDASILEAPILLENIDQNSIDPLTKKIFVSLINPDKSLSLTLVYSNYYLDIVN